MFSSFAKLGYGVVGASLGMIASAGGLKALSKNPNALVPAAKWVGYAVLIGIGTCVTAVSTTAAVSAANDIFKST